MTTGPSPKRCTTNKQKPSKHDDDEVKRTAEIAAVGRPFAARVGHRQQPNGRVTVDRIGHVGCVTSKAVDISTKKSRLQLCPQEVPTVIQIYATSTQNASLEARPSTRPLQFLPKSFPPPLSLLFTSVSALTSDP